MNLDTTLLRVFAISVDPDFLQKVKTITDPTYELCIFDTASECIQHIHFRPGIIFLDFQVDDVPCAKLLKQTQKFDENIFPIVFHQNNNFTDYDLLLQSGAYDCFPKSELASTKILHTIAKIEKLLHLNSKMESLQVKIHNNFTKYMVASSAPMQRVARLIEKASLTNISCYITGKASTGKGLAAYIIHCLSDRQQFPYISLNLSTIPKEEVEKILFGMEKGANAEATIPGKLESAANGTLHLEEISSLNAHLQARLLEVLRTGSISRIGGERSISFQARLIVSTRKNLFEEMMEGNFREDLYYCLTGLPIPIPPLHQRGNDILLLAKNFLEQFLTNNKIPEKVFSKKAMKKLLSYSFPGNVRELKSTVERAAAISNNNIITEDDIEFLGTKKQLEFLDQEMTFEEYKSRIIHHFLEKYNNDILIVSNKLDIGKSTIYRMLKSEKEKEKKKFTWFNLF